MTRVVAAVDGSPVSGEVLRAAVVLAELLGAQAEALYVGGAPAHDLQCMADATGVRLTCRDGLAAVELSEVLREPDVVLGVVGTSGVGETKSAEGHTAASMMSGADKPLLVVPPGSFPPRRRHIHRALVPLDGRQESADAVEAVLRLLGEVGVDIVVVHVFDQAPVPSFRDQPQHAAPVWERAFLHRNLPFQRARLHLRQGKAASEIVQTAHDEGPDLVVVGWSQDLSAGHARTLQDLLSTCGLPVLLLPAVARTMVAADVVAGPVIDLTQVSPAASRAGSGGES